MKCVLFKIVNGINIPPRNSGGQRKKTSDSFKKGNYKKIFFT